jgi:hypothetical protein
LPTSRWVLYIFAGPYSDVGKGRDSRERPIALASCPPRLDRASVATPSAYLRRHLPNHGPFLFLNTTVFSGQDLICIPQRPEALMYFKEQSWDTYKRENKISNQSTDMV